MSRKFWAFSYRFRKKGCTLALRCEWVHMYLQRRRWGTCTGKNVSLRDRDRFRDLSGRWAFGDAVRPEGARRGGEGGRIWRRSMAFRTRSRTSLYNAKTGNKIWPFIWKRTRSWCVKNCKKMILLEQLGIQCWTNSAVVVWAPLWRHLLPIGAAHVQRPRAGSRLGRHWVVLQEVCAPAAMLTQLVACPSTLSSLQFDCKAQTKIWNFTHHI